MSDKILIRYKSNNLIIKREELAAILTKEFEYSLDHPFILQYLDIINIIQIYEDFVVRLHLKNSHYEPKTSLFLYDLSERLIWTFINLCLDRY